MAIVGFFRANPDAYFVFGEGTIINEAGKIIGKHPAKDWDLKEAINDRHHALMSAAFLVVRLSRRFGTSTLSEMTSIFG